MLHYNFFCATQHKLYVTACQVWKYCRQYYILVRRYDRVKGFFRNGSNHVCPFFWIWAFFTQSRELKLLKKIFLFHFEIIIQRNLYKFISAKILNTRFCHKQLALEYHYRTRTFAESSFELLKRAMWKAGNWNLAFIRYLTMNIPAAYWQLKVITI